MLLASSALRMRSAPHAAGHSTSPVPSPHPSASRRSRVARFHPTTRALARRHPSDRARAAATPSRPCSAAMPLSSTSSPPAGAAAALRTASAPCRGATHVSTLVPFLSLITICLGIGLGYDCNGELAIWDCEKSYYSCSCV